MDNVVAGRMVIVTGGSAGIGRAAVELFARKRANVVLAARGARRGQEVATQLHLPAVRKHRCREAGRSAGGPGCRLLPHAQGGPEESARLRRPG